MSRGRPRNAEARTRVLRAARTLLEQGGPGGVTIEAVAAKSGVSKPTIYRTWSNAQAVMMAALMASETTAATPPRHASALSALRRQLREIAATFASRTGRNVTMMLASADPETELSKVFRHHFILARREEGRRMLASAIASGELRANFDLDIALDSLYGPLFFRILVGHGVVDETFCERLLEQLLRGLAAKGGRSSKPRR